MNLFRELFKTREGKALTATAAAVGAIHDRRAVPFRPLGGTNINTQNIRSAFVQAQSASYAYMYGTQPAVRSVVDYLARNVAQLGLKVYHRVSDDEREHDGDHPAARLVRLPNPYTPGQQFVFNLLADFLVYDNAYALKLRPSAGGNLTALNVPPHAVGIVGETFFTPEAYRIWRVDGTFFDVDVEDVIHWRGYNPEDPRGGFSKLETLRQELAADAAARAAKTEIDKSGLSMKGWIERPLDAPDLSDEAAGRLSEDLANQARAQGRRFPLLEEGMQFKQASISPEQAQMLEGRQFTRREVASLYGLENIPPEDEEERRQVYADVLPPLCEMLCAYLDLHLLQVEYGDDDHYFEFNLDEKQMSDDRIKALTSASGAPIFTRNESRARVNLPAVEGGDELITPANVLVGANPKPSIDVMPIQDPNKPSQDGDHREDDEPKALLGPESKQLEITTLPRPYADMARQKRAIDKATGAMGAFYKRQGNSLTQKAQVDWDKWDRALAGEIHNLARQLVELEGSVYVAYLGGGDFDMGQVENYLKTMAAKTAENFNATTRHDIEERGVEAAIARARGERTLTGGASIGTRATLFGRYAAAEQSPGFKNRTKTWIADTDRHSGLGGVTVAIDRDWGGIQPGSEPNCKCSFSIS